MDNKTQLFNIPIPFDDESLKGLIIRACMYNYCNTPLWLYESANLKVRNRPIDVNYIDENKLDILTDMLKVKVDIVSNLTFNNVLKDCDVTIKNSILHVGIGSLKTKVCPKCLEYCGYQRKIWDCHFYLVCPVHNCKLIENCPKCNLLISSYRRNVLQCECGFMYPDATVDPCEHEEILGFSKILHNKLYSKSEFGIQILHCLDHLDFAQIIYLVAHLSMKIQIVLQ